MLKTLENIFSQDLAIATLRQALEMDRLPHGLIFAGMAGVGKRTTAEALAAIWLCENPKPALACGTCQSCRLMTADTHPDFHLVYRQLIRLEKEQNKARDLSVDVIRDYLIGPANLKPNMGRGKVFVVEEAELMNASAQNAMLKTLEEPLGRTLIILLTDQPGVLLPTIRSRSQIVNFAPLKRDVIIQQLKGRGIDGEKADQAARFADGSLGLAVRWLEDGVIAQAEALRVQIESLISGRAVPELAGWFKKAAENYSAMQIEHDKNASKEQTTHDGLGVYFRLASLILREKLKIESDPDRLERICQAIDAIAEAELLVDANVTVALVLMKLSMALDRELIGR